MPALNHRFKSSWDYHVPASGRFARGTVLSGDHVGALPHSSDLSQSFSSVWVRLACLNSADPPATRAVVLPSWDRGTSDNSAT